MAANSVAGFDGPPTPLPSLPASTDGGGNVEVNDRIMAWANLVPSASSRRASVCSSFDAVVLDSDGGEVANVMNEEDARLLQPLNADCLKFSIEPPNIINSPGNAGISLIFYARETSNSSTEESVKKLRIELDRMMSEKGELEMEVDKVRSEDNDETKNKRLLPDLDTKEWHILLFLLMAFACILLVVVVVQRMQRQFVALGRELDTARAREKTLKAKSDKELSETLLALSETLQALDDSEQSKKKDQQEMENMVTEIETVRKLDETESSGQILFRKNNFKAFLQENGTPTVFNEPVEFINGLPWVVQIKRSCNKEWIGFHLCCKADVNDSAWSCRADFQLSIVSSCAQNDACLGRNEKEITVLHTNTGWGLDNFVKCDELMDPLNGFYDSKTDTVTFKAVVVIKEPKGIPGGVRTDEHTMLVNGNVMHVNKYLLAAHSKFFRNFFFGMDADATPKVEVDEDVVEHFERFIGTMYPRNLDLDDKCVMGVLRLANHFLLHSVVNHCVDFLLKKSKKSAMVKFRLAHECGIVGMKNKVLAGMTKDDFAVGGDIFMDNFSEYNKLGAEAMQELRKRHTELLGASN